MNEIKEEFDLIVVGGGTAGSCAAMAAARMGIKVAVIEQLGYLGGTSTGGQVNKLMPSAVNGNELIFGINMEIRKITNIVENRKNDPLFDTEHLKFVLENWTIQSGVNIYYHTHFIAPRIRENRISDIRVINKDGEQKLRAKYYIDASGDADLAYRAGVPVTSGRNDRYNQPASLRFSIGGVDIPKLENFIGNLTGNKIKIPPDSISLTTDRAHSNIRKLIDKALEEGIVSPTDIHFFVLFGTPGRTGEISLNCPEIKNIRNAGAKDWTRVNIEGRRIIQSMFKFLNKYVDGFNKAYISRISDFPGFRETRRIVGDYVLTEDDVVKARKFDDGIVPNTFGIDIHNPVNDDVAILKGNKSGKPVSGDYYEIPYRCLLPQKIDNLLIAGRCLSADFEAQASARTIQCCRAMGECAGTVAALSVKQNINPRFLKIDDLRRYYWYKKTKFK